MRICIFLLLLQSGCGLALFLPRVLPRISRTGPERPHVRLGGCALCAKKKGSKLVSDDLLTSLGVDDEPPVAVEPKATTTKDSTSSPAPAPAPLSKKEKKLAKFGLSESLLSSIEDQLDESSSFFLKFS